jgi:hypothetical protein
MDREGERLTEELEAHVESSSIRLQEEFLAANQVLGAHEDPPNHQLENLTGQIWQRRPKSTIL